MTVDTWRLQGFQPGQGLAAGAHTDGYDDADWLPVDVPGDVHRALIAAGQIDDPFYDRNERACAWIEEREWWYRAILPAPAPALADDERLLIFFDGLDTYATVWLNGEKLGEHRNMFRPAEYDVTNALRPAADNTVAVCFHRPLDFVAGFDVSHWWLNEAPRVAMRKAQYGYGWDWGPRLPTVGIWRDARVVRQRRAVLDGVHFYTIEATPQQALVAVQVEATILDGERMAHVRVSLRDEHGHVAGAAENLSAAEANTSAKVYMAVSDPKLWWTHDLGEPHLYELQVGLFSGDEQVDEKTMQVGIRTIELDQSPDADEPGTRFFRFVLNGIPIFARGANWIPAHSFVGGVEPERYANLLGMALDANMNMLRVWGGGIYEHDEFYALCDSLGILVWQDFMFACAMYPESPQWFVDEVRQEASYQVRRLRSHPCLALWCGNNENQWLHERAYWNEDSPIAPGALYYDEILPQAVAHWDGAVPYWPGSPYGGSDYNSESDGDSHNWNVWHGNSPRRFGEEPRVDHSPAGVSYRRYAEDKSRFCSEFGMHAAPVLETLRRTIPADQLYHHSPSMDHHNKDNPKNKGDNLMLAVTGLPDTLGEYIDYSMAAQAEGLKFGIEHFRRRKPHCSGTLFWQLNDCWPVLSWSVIDYYGFGKAGYYYARRAYAPVLASFKEEPNGKLALWITNDTLQEITDRLDLRLTSFAGELLWSETVDVSVAVNASVEVWRGSLQADVDRVLTVDGRHVSENRHFFAAIKDLALPATSVVVLATQLDAHRVEVHLKADAYVYLVHLSTSMETTRYSDNYFDLRPDQEGIVIVTDNEHELTAGSVTVATYVGQQCIVEAG